MTERRAPMSGDTAVRASASLSNATSISEAWEPLSAGAAGASVIMEGVLKKRGANLPVMRDRYCVATWEADDSQRKYVLLRTYKNQKSFAKSPEKPASVHALKCFGEWDGKGNFHRYDHAFLMETRDSKVFFCVAPTDTEKRQWIDVMRSAAPASSRGDDSISISGSAAGDTGTGQSMSSSGARRSVAKRQSSRMIRDEASERSLFENDGEQSAHGNGDVDDGDDDAHLVTDSEQSPDDGLFRSSSGANSTLSASDRGGTSKDEPADWGIFGESTDGPGVSRYDVVDRPVLLLDAELLAKPDDKTALASDAFLFEDASRFGAVHVANSRRASDDDLADFVDETLAARLEREKSAKQLRRRAQKLESNRDLYAEMAAARLNSMRKDARHPPRKSPREFTARPSLYVGDASEYTASDDGYSHVTEAGFDLADSEADLLFGDASAAASAHAHKPRGHVGATDSEEEEVEADGHDEADGGDGGDGGLFGPLSDEGELQRKSKNRKHRKREAEAAHVEVSDELAHVRSAADVREATEETAVVSVDEDADDAPAAEVPQSRKRKSKHKAATRSREDGGDNDDAPAPIAELVVYEAPASAMDATDAQHKHSDAGEHDDDDEEERRREKERRRQERRARREQQRQEEEEAAAAAAAELARQHRAAMREREEEKARKREKKERRERRERAKLDKEKQQRKAKEAKLQAEVESLRLAQLQQRAEDERKDKKKKNRREKERYSTPAERIQRKEREAEAHAAEMSNALVLLETPVDAAVVALTPSSASAVVTPAATPAASAEMSLPAVAGPAAVAVSATVSSDAIAAQPVVATPAAAAAPVAVVVPMGPPLSAGSEQQQQLPPVSGIAATAAAGVPQAPQSQPSYSMMPPYVPGYPAPPQSLPLYASAPYGAYQYPPPQAYYPSPYGGMAYGPGMSIPPQFFQSPVGYMPGAPPSMMPHAAYSPSTAAAYPSFAPSPPPHSSDGAGTWSDSTEPAFIGPKLPSPRVQSSSGAASIGPPPPPPGTSTPSPALPDLPDLPDIADF